MDETRDDPERPRVPPTTRPAVESAEVPDGAGPHAPGPVEGTDTGGTESGGYGGEGTPRRPDNRKGGYGAG